MKNRGPGSGTRRFGGPKPGHGCPRVQISRSEICGGIRGSHVRPTALTPTRAVVRSEQIEARGRRNSEPLTTGCQGRVYVEGFRRPRTKRCDAYRHGASGFTLLELIIALAIVATMVVILLGGFRIWISAWNQGEERAEAHQHLRSLTELFRRSLTSARPYKARPKEGGEPLVLFQGDADGVNFVTPAPPFPNEAPIAFTAVRLTFQQGEESGLAIRQKALPNEEPFENTPPLHVDREVVGASFKYQSASGEWVDSWDGASEKKIPLAVQIELQRVVRGKVESLPPFTIALQASQP